MSFHHRLPAALRWRAVVASMTVLGAALSAGRLPAGAADAVPCAGEELVVAVVEAIFAADAVPADVNGDERVSAADLAATASRGLPPACPATGARLRVVVENRTGAPAVAATLSGARLGCDCLGAEMATSFTLALRCLGDAPARCADVDGLAPGTWLLDLAVEEPATGQRQARRLLLVAAAEPVSVEWRAYASVLVVDDTGNTGIGSLRNRLQLVRDVPKPALIQFDPVVFPPGQLSWIEIDFQLTNLDASDVTVDAIDPLGLAGNRGVDAGEEPIGAFSISGARNEVIGLRLRGTGGEDRDVLRIAGPEAVGNSIEQVIVEGRASGDGIGVDDGAGNGFGASTTSIRRSQVSGAADKGIKVTTGAFARIEDTWVHDNENGGIQATLGGHVLVIDSVVERNAGVGAENGLSVQGLAETDALATLAGFGNLVRGNGGNGISVRSFATGTVVDTAFVDNGTGGARVFNDVDEPALAVFEGTTFACNAADGVLIGDDSGADLGGGAFASRGGNALIGNGAGGLGVQLRNVSSQASSARSSQWQACGGAAVCDPAVVLAEDVRDAGAGVAVEPVVAPGGLASPRVDEVVPPRGRAGERFRIFGAGFDAFAGYGGAACVLPEVANGCDPVVGNCVTVGGLEAEVEAVTPTMLIARWPATCLEPVDLQVRVARIDRPAASAAVRVCTNP